MENTCEVDASTKYVYEIPAGKTFVRLQGAQGKTVEFANINTTDQVLSSTYARVLVNAAVTDGTNVDPFKGATHPEVAEINANRYSSRSVMVTPKEDVSSVRHFVEPTSIRIDAGSRSIAGHTDNFNIEDIKDGIVTEYEINRGDYYKYVWLDSNVNMDSYSVKKVTLRALGRDDSNALKCLVWVEDSCYRSSGTASGKMVTKEIAQELADKFAQHCESERAVFGDEAETFVAGGGSNGKALNDPVYGSDTKNYVNIVIYDIGADYNKGQQCGVAGYFYAKDYLSEGNYNGYNTYDSNLAGISNHGKYFYIDAPFCNYVSNNNYTGNNNKVSETIISTLFHEFQHKKSIFRVFPPVAFQQGKPVSRQTGDRLRAGKQIG